MLIARVGQRKFNSPARTVATEDDTVNFTTRIKKLIKNRRRRLIIPRVSRSDDAGPKPEVFPSPSERRRNAPVFPRRCHNCRIQRARGRTSECGREGETLSATCKIAGLITNSKISPPRFTRSWLRSCPQTPAGKNEQCPTRRVFSRRVIHAIRQIVFFMPS